MTAELHGKDFDQYWPFNLSSKVDCGSYKYLSTCLFFLQLTAFSNGPPAYSGSEHPNS